MSPSLGANQQPSAPTSDSERPGQTVCEEPDGRSSFLRVPKRGESAKALSPPLNSRSGALRRAFSVPHSRRSSVSKDKEKSEDKEPTTGVAKWAKLRSLLPHIVYPDESIIPGPSAVTSQAVNITDELITGGLSTLILRLWFERDEKGHRRVPLLFHRLRIRVSDSLHPMHQTKSVFRIECEYANGAVRWVVYRELRDFLSLHAHYTVSNVYNRNVDKMPEFPTTSLPYFKFLSREKGGKVDKTDFARLQREALENYLIGLIRAVMFHPSSNRLAGFLEISALSTALTKTGGAQYKAGYLRIEANTNGGTSFGRKSASWKDRKESRWCAVHESYLVVVEEPGELTIWDVFMLDQDFRIERPKRYYRQGLGNLLHGQEKTEIERPQQKHATDSAEQEKEQDSRHSHPPSLMAKNHDSECTSIISSIKTQLSKESQSHGDDETDQSASSIGSPLPSRPPTPMLDPSTNTNPIHEGHPDEDHGNKDHEGSKTEKAKQAAKVSGDVSKHTFYILFARNETAATSHYTGSNRFDSFAPIRLNVAAQWLVDGRDYFWNLSRAMLLAKESIYIHDWWLSPELQMRRPEKDKYRLDRLLERKAKEGVKIYVILYQEVSNRTTPTDSNYAKQRLIGMHPNVMVQRSPSHFQTGTFYWAHHEKLCVIDQTIAFMGGLDLCFGRWDTPQHVLTDDTAGTDRSEIWPGKDYSNPRMSDFYNLHKPEEDMYDRTKIPRMPCGQPARDLARHFNHTRVMPFLLPPSEFRPGELTQMGLTGTCELQICRSAGPWSLGTPSRIEHSIQNAYLKAIQMSEHFVYIENQFFITSTVVNDVKIENKIGDAIVHRILRAHRDRTPWMCCILIPVLPGFTFPIDHSDASAIRIIVECQNRTISRGPHSIFSRLRKEGINPDDHISVFSLRNWAKMRGDVLTTEQVYIHGKVCIVDDRLAIIGSANINERSQRGDRDSELAAVIRDTDMIDSTMAGKPFKVGRFAHTLRMRLMREHLGIDVDALDEEDIMAHQPVKPEYEQDVWDPDQEQEYGEEGGVTYIKKSEQKSRTGTMAANAMDSINQAADAWAEASSNTTSNVLRKVGLVHGQPGQDIGAKTLEAERKDYNEEGQQLDGFASSVVPTLEEITLEERRPSKEKADEGRDTQNHREDSRDEGDAEEHVHGGGAHEPRSEDGVLFGTPADAPSPGDDTDEEQQAAPGARTSIRENLANRPGKKHHWTVVTVKPRVEPEDFEDPLSESFWKDIWVASAIHNTEIYRKVFHAVPDDLVTTWKQYKEFVTWHERLSRPVKFNIGEPVARVPSETSYGDENTQEYDATDLASQTTKEETDDAPTTPSYGGVTPSSSNEGSSKQRRHARGSDPFEKWERDEMEKLLEQLNGQLVVYPHRFLEGEDIANNFLFNADRLLPLPIYD
ncbi:hypothetical protein CPB84DRAFT_1813208 [Gymnopilus junonius]|uniref:Phospholipase n=1 Tax=Gymnopilus junonius TaxID=109634 RepID=A0A9P5TR91_GYMJU|nr:hypothetical protein CPB84DRAFT_1813208 [Gymnopilus junonius]